MNTRKAPESSTLSVVLRLDLLPDDRVGRRAPARASRPRSATSEIAVSIGSSAIEPSWWMSELA